MPPHILPDRRYLPPLPAFHGLATETSRGYTHAHTYPAVIQMCLCVMVSSAF